MLFCFFADERYQLLAFVVMPSHHHWLFLPRPEWVDSVVASFTPGQKRKSPRESISHSIQSYTANQCNRILEKQGTFWQGETFDHFARDKAEVMRIIQYIENNPVQAGLVENASQWPWSSASIRDRMELEPGTPIPKIVG